MIPVSVRRPSGTTTRRPASAAPSSGAVREVNTPSPAGTFSATAYSSFGGIVFLFGDPAAHALGLEHLEPGSELAPIPELDDPREPLGGCGAPALEEAQIGASLRDQPRRRPVVLVQPELRAAAVPRTCAENVRRLIGEPR